MKNEYKNSSATFLAYWLLFAVTFFVMYYPLLVFQFLTGDDFNYYFHWNHPAVMEKYPGYFVLGTDHWLTDCITLLGRPFANCFHCLAARLMRDLSHYTLMRSVPVALASLLASLFALRLTHRFKMKKELAFLTSFLIFTLPGMMFYVVYYSFSLSWMASLFLTMASVELIEKVSVKEGLVQSMSDLRSLFLALSSGLLLIIALLVYQPTAVFFVVCTALWLLFTPASDWILARRSLLRNFFLFIMTIVTYFILFKCVLLPLFQHSHPDSTRIINAVMPQYQFRLGGGFLEKIIHLRNVNVLALSLWNMFPNMKIAQSVLIIFGLSLILKTFQEVKACSQEKQSIFRVILRNAELAAFIFSLCLFANVQNISPGALVLNRQVFPYAALWVLFVVWSVMRVGTLLKSNLRNRVAGFVLCIFAVTSGFLTCDRVLRWITINHVVENRFIQYQLAQNIKNGRISYKEVNRIHVVMPPWGKSFLGLPFGVGDEIYSASARADKVPGLIHFNLMQLGLGWNDVSILNEGTWKDSAADRDKIRFEVTASNAYPLTASPGQVVIDMNEIMPLTVHPFQSSSSRLGDGELVQLNESVPGPHPARYAFDGSVAAGDYWETGPVPLWVQVKYPHAVEIKKYVFQSGYTAQERMPRAWQLQGSNDGVRWALLDERTHQTDWKSNMSRSYSVAEPFPYLFYRFTFTEGNDPILIRIYEITMSK